MKYRKRRFVAEVESIEGRLLLSTAPQFTVKDLGLGSNVGGINSFGQIVGSIVIDSQSHQAALSNLNGDQFQSLGIPKTIGNSVNDLGHVAGIMSNIYAFVLSNSQVVDIGGISTLGISHAYGINNLDNVVGDSLMPNSQLHAFFYDGAVHDIGTSGSNSTATGINDSNQITGVQWDSVTDGQYHAFFYDGMMHDLGTLGGHYSFGYAINASGQVAGQSQVADGSCHAFISAPNGGGLHDLGLPAGAFGDIAYAINDSGHSDGFLSMVDGSRHGFYYDGTKIFDLNSLIPSNSGFMIQEAHGINNSDQIAAIGVDSSGQTHVLLLTPIPQPITPMITWSNPADIVYGTPISATQLNATADVPGTFTYNVAQGTVLHAGAAQVIQATFTPDDLTRYTTATAEVSINVLKAPLTVTANNAQVRYPFQIPPLTGTITGLVNGDTDVATYTTTAVQGSWAGYYPIVPHLTDPNYNITFVNGTLTIYWSVPPGGF